MRIVSNGHNHKVWASKRDTYAWAHKAGAYWPCSQLSDKSLFFELWQGDLVDLAINGKSGYDIDSNELNAFIEDIALGNIK